MDNKSYKSAHSLYISEVRKQTYKSFSNGNFMLLKIEEAKKEIEDPKSILILFWVLWVLITFGWAIEFCFLDNKWLNK